MRSRSLLRYDTARGRNVGLMITDRDEWVLRELVRWYALQSAQLVRRLWIEDKRAWHPLFGAEACTFDKGGAFHKEALKQSLRLGRLARINESATSSVAPVVASTRYGDGIVAWWATPAGARQVGLNRRRAGEHGWVNRPSINPLSARHAFAAADIGTQLETYGWTVAAERELRRGLLVDGTEMSAEFYSAYRSTNKTRDVMKSPDLAIMSANFDRYIAIEVERESDRPINVYAEKLRAYQLNTCIDAVWYVCMDDTTATRVKRAAERVFGERPMRVRVRVADQQHGFWHLPLLNSDDNPNGQFDPELNSDLNLLNDRTVRMGIQQVGG